VNERTLVPGHSSSTQFCTLAYKPGCRGDDLGIEPIVLAVVTKSAGSNLRIQVHPDWRSFVDQADRDYVESLFADFRTRAESDPNALFQQLASLGVGPVLTHETGSNISDHPHLLTLCKFFADC